MTIHKEGYRTIFVAFCVLLLINAGAYYLNHGVDTLIEGVAVVSMCVFFLVVNFFRSPKREGYLNDKAVLSPADGKVVVIEEVFEPEVLNQNCRQVSIFMSPLNVHVNWFPISGVIKYFRHHSGRFMKAYLPKSSTENERSSIVLEHKSGEQILVRQVAGAMARRIVSYAEEEKAVKQADQLGFIKFGSRLDVYLPLSARIDVQLDQKVKGKQTILGWLQ
jgi:phosphatidylserine decarboxylase